jgi:hypothetical protein
MEGIYYHYIYHAPIMVDKYIFADMFIDDKKGIAVFNCENSTLTYETLTPDNFSVENINFPLCAINDMNDSSSRYENNPQSVPGLPLCRFDIEVFSLHNFF